MHFMRHFLIDDDGPTAVEYAVMLALIIGLCIGAIGVFGNTAAGSWQDSSTKLGAKMGGS